jgi:uncharacterized repeat protein (TIGR01451 family)
LLAAIGTALLALLMAAALAPRAAAQVSAFQTLESSPTELTSVAADPTSSLIYAQENGGKAYFVYDPRTNVWSELAPSPLSSGNNGGAAYLGGKIYVSYTDNDEKVAVYDIASNSWTTIDNPLGLGTADITSGNGKLYMAENLSFVQYDPATGIATPLAEPPVFADEEECGEEGFEPWGGLQFDGTRIFGHQGDGCTGFGVYDLATNSWAQLALTPMVRDVEEEEEGKGEGEGPVAGSALYPSTNTYLAYGPYEGNALYRYDIEAGTWSVLKLPFKEVDDGGMAYISLPGHEGVYMIQGEIGTGFARYTEQNATDLSVAMSAALAGSAKGGEITYSIQVKNNGPERAGGVVLADALPPGTTLVAAAASQGTCGGTVSCSLGVLPSGGSASVTIKVSAGFGTITDTAAVSSQAADTNAANDSATVVTSVPACVVPKLKGLRIKRAKKALRAANCRPGKVKHHRSRKVKKGRVIRGGKHRGTVLAVGTKVNLTVSSGAKHKHGHHHKAKGTH